MVVKRNIVQEYVQDSTISTVGLVQGIQSIQSIQTVPVVFAPQEKKIPITHIIKDKKVLDYICYNQVIQRAYEVQRKTGLSAATIIGQKGVESNWDKSSLCKKTKNYGNIKCFKKHNHKKFGCVQAWDKIEKSNHYYVKAKTNWKGWSLYTNLIYKRYMKAASQSDIKDQLIWLKKKGYATDKNYVKTIWGVIQKYNLDKLQRYIDSGYTITTTNGKFILFQP